MKKTLFKGTWIMGVFKKKNNIEKKEEIIQNDFPNLDEKQELEEIEEIKEYSLKYSNKEIFNTIRYVSFANKDNKPENILDHPIIRSGVYDVLEIQKEENPLIEESCTIYKPHDTFTEYSTVYYIKTESDIYISIETRFNRSVRGIDWTPHTHYRENPTNAVETFIDVYGLYSNEDKGVVNKKISIVNTTELNKRHRMDGQLREYIEGSEIEHYIASSLNCIVETLEKYKEAQIEEKKRIQREQKESFVKQLKDCVTEEKLEDTKDCVLKYNNDDILKYLENNQEYELTSIIKNKDIVSVSKSIRTEAHIHPRDRIYKVFSIKTKSGIVIEIKNNKYSKNIPPICITFVYSDEKYDIENKKVELVDYRESESISDPNLKEHLKGNIVAGYIANILNSLVEELIDFEERKLSQEEIWELARKEILNKIVKRQN